MKDLKFATKKPLDWNDDVDNFAGSNVPPVAVGSDVQPGNGIIDAVIDVAVKTKDMIVDESKTIAPDVVAVFSDSKLRLDSEHRIINAIPNSYLFYGLVGVTGYLIIKYVL